MASSLFQSKGMIIKDPDKFFQKISKFVQDGPGALLVITDFDRTLTRYYKHRSSLNEPLEQELSSHQVLLSSTVLPPTVAEKDRELFEHYYPLEISPSLSSEEKLPLMEQWWESINALLVESKVTKEQVKRAVDSMMKLLRDHQVPTLVFSAGLYDIIHLALEREAVASDNVQVVSNAMNFGAEGVIEGFSGDIIHPLNKTARVLIDSSVWSHHQRRNVLLLGDSRGDVHMADGLEIEEIIRIGFLNIHVEDALEEYLDLYDVVLANDANLCPVENFLKQIVKVVKN